MPNEDGPSEGNLRLARSGIWEVWDGRDWVYLSEYYPASPRAGVSVEQQQKAISDLQKALNVMDVTEVTGTNPENYQYTVGPGAGSEYEEAGLFKMNTRQLQREAANLYYQGVQPQMQYTGDVLSAMRELGFGDCDGCIRFRISEVKYDEFGQMERENKEWDEARDRWKYSGPVVREWKTDSSAIHAGLAALKAQQGLVGEVNTSLTLQGQEFQLVGGHLIEGPEVKPPPGQRVETAVRNPVTREVISIRVTEPDGSYTYLKPGSPKAQEWTNKIKSEGGIVPPDVDAAARLSPGQPSAATTGGLPITPFGRRIVDPSERLIENVLPGYNAMQTGPERWELVPQPGFTPATRAGQVIENIVEGYDAIATADGRLQLVEKAPGEGEELEMFRPFGLGDGRFIIRTGPDDFETVTSAGESWFLDDWGNAYMRDVSGNLQPVEPPTIDEQINRALVEGDAGKAMALSDFRDRPSAEERMRLAMEFARTPGDLMAISSIVRGLVEPPPPAPGQVRRVADPPDWVVDAWKDLTSAWGVSSDLASPAPGISAKTGVTPGAVKDALQTGEFDFIWEAQDISEEGNKDTATNVVYGGDSGVEGGIPKATPVSFRTAAGWNGGRDDPFPTTFAAGWNGGGDDPFPTTFAARSNGGTGDGQKPGVQFQGQRYATPFAAALAARDAAPVVSAAAQDMANLGFGGREGNIATALQNIADELFAKYGHLGFTHDMFHAAIQDLITTRPDLDLVGRIWAARDLLTEEWEQKHLSDILGDDYPTDLVTGKPLDPNVVLGGAKPTLPGFGGETDPSELGPAWLSNEDMQAALPDTPWKTQEELALIGWRPGGTVAPTSPTTPAPVAAAIAATGGNASYDPSTGTFSGPDAEDAREIAEAVMASDDDDDDFFSPEPASAPDTVEISVEEDWGQYDPDPDPEPTPDEIYEEAYTEAIEAMGGDGAATEQAWDVDPDFYDIGFAGGGKTFRDTMALVGEEGPELVRLPEGAEVIPADFTEAMLEGRRPRRMQYGGMVQIGGAGGKKGPGRIVRESDLEALRRGASLAKTEYQDILDPALRKTERDRLMRELEEGTTQFQYQGGQYVQETRPQSPGMLSAPEKPRYPAGVQQVLAGRPIEQPRSLFRPAGLRTPSAQAMRNLVPEEMEAYRELGTLAGIPKGAFEREFREAMPGGQARVRRPRFQARRQRRL